MNEARRGAIVLILAGLTLFGCDKRAQESNSPEKATIRQFESTDDLHDTSAHLSPEHPMPVPRMETTYWTDTAETLSEDSVEALRDAFSGFSKSLDTVYRFGPVWDSLSAIAKELFDFRYTEGSQNFFSLKNDSLEGQLLLGSRPKEGFSYYMVGSQGQMLQPPLIFDSMQVKLLLSSEEGNSIQLPAWLGSSPSAAANRLVDSLQGNAILLGSKHSLIGSPLTDAPINDSLKRFILERIFPNESTWRIFAGIDFFPAGEDGRRKRFFISFAWEEQHNPIAICAVEVAEGKCELLFFINGSSTAIINSFSVTTAPVADVFVARIYESVLAIMEVRGKWIAIEFEYSDYYNRG